MGDCLRAGKPSLYVTSHLGQLSLPSFWGRQIEYQLIGLGLRQGAFTCIGWQVTLCDLIRQVTLCSSEMGFIKSYNTTFNFLTRNYDHAVSGYLTTDNINVMAN